MEKIALYYHIQKKFHNGSDNWLEKAEELIKDGKVDVYETEALNKILEKIKLKPIYLTDSTMEVDNHEDLAKARDLFQKK